MKKLFLTCLIGSFSFILHASSQKPSYVFKTETYAPTNFKKQNIIEMFKISVTDTCLEPIATAEGQIESLKENFVCNLKDITVHEDYRGQGIGKKIMGMVKMYAEREKCSSIILQSTFTAHRFYQKLGFVKDGETSGTIPYRLLLSQTDV